MTEKGLPKYSIKGGICNKKDCKHEKQSFTRIMYVGRPCESYNTCLDCHKILPADLNRNFNL